MKVLLIFCAVAFVIGTVSGCDERNKTECITINKNSVSKATTDVDKCITVNAVRGCVAVNAGCNADTANTAASQVETELGLNCIKVDPDWEKTGKCLLATHQCEDQYNKIITAEPSPNNDQICQAIEVYETCAKKDCHVAEISRKMTMFMERARISCANIHISLCLNVLKYETCIQAFTDAVSVLALKEHEQVMCLLANSFEICLRKDAMCELQTIRAVMKKSLDTLDCSEYFRLCDHQKEEACSAAETNIDGSCAHLKSYRACLVRNDTCPGGHANPILRKVMNDKNTDCAEIDACQASKEEVCLNDAGKAKELTEKAEKCKQLNAYKSCMENAKCNQLYLNSKFDVVKKDLGNPCGASSILASIGLTLLLAAFTGQWK